MTETRGNGPQLAQPQVSQLRRWGGYVLAALVLLGGGVITAGVVAQRQGARLAAEQSSYGAFSCVCSLVEGWVRSSPVKRWPASWAELEAMPARDFGSFVWPRDAEKIRALVEVDFSADLEAVLRATPEGFTAIRPRYPSRVFQTQPVTESFLGSLARAAKS